MKWRRERKWIVGAVNQSREWEEGWGLGAFFFLSDGSKTLRVCLVIRKSGGKKKN